MAGPARTKRYLFFRRHAVGGVGHNAVTAMRLARAEERAEDLGLSVQWTEEDHLWDGDCPAPEIHVWGCVRHPQTGATLASLGGVGLTSWRDPYVRVVEAELLLEAIEALAGQG
jgi:hypothetical protein